MAENSNKKQTIMEAVRLAYENSKKINGYEGDDSSKHLKANKVSYSPEDTAYITSSCTDVNQAINIIDSYVKNGLDTANLKITGISYVNGITKIGEHASFDNNSTSIFGVRFTGDATVFSSGVTVNGGLSVSGSSTFSGSVGLPYGTTVKGPDGQTANLWDKISSAAAPTAQNVYGITKDSDTVTREIDPADGKLKFTAKGGGVGVIELSDSQVQSIDSHNTITFTAEQANLIKQDNIGFIVVKYQGLFFINMSVSKATIENDSIYTLGGVAEFAPGFPPFTFTLFVADFTQPAKILYRKLPEYYLSKVEIGGDDSLVFSQNDDVNYTKIYVDTINGSPIIHDHHGSSRDHSFVENKAVPFLSKYSVLIPDYSTDVTILPCTTADNGKVLSVVNGEAQWVSAGGGTEIKSTNIYFGYKQKMKDWEVGDADYLDSELVQITPKNTKTVCYLPYNVSYVIKPHGSNTATLFITYESTNESSGYVKGRINIVCLKAGKSSLDLSLTQKRLYTE